MKIMQEKLCFVLCFFILVGFTRSNAHQVLEDFDGYSVGKTPNGWKPREGDPSKHYWIRKTPEGQYLQAIDNGESVQIAKKVSWKLKDFPYLQWKWRVNEFPKGSDERKGHRNDSAVGMYVIFPKRFFIPEAIKYVWSESVPKKTVVRRYKRFPTLVIRSGKEKKGRWVTEFRNIKQDYEKLFGRKAPNPVAIGFLTDSNSMGGNAKGDYDDLILYRKPPKKEKKKK